MQDLFFIVYYDPEHLGFGVPSWVEHIRGFYKNIHLEYCLSYWLYHVIDLHLWKVTDKFLDHLGNVFPNIQDVRQLLEG